LVELELVVGRGLFATAALWEPLQTAQRWIVEAARILTNQEEMDAAAVEAGLRALRTEARHEARKAQRRFRRDPAAYLAQLEARLCSL
jgi:hypothetical protein